MALIDANRGLDGLKATVDTLHIESIHEDPFGPPEDDPEYYAVGISGTVYHLTKDTYKKLEAHMRANANRL